MTERLRREYARKWTWHDDTEIIRAFVTPRVTQKQLAEAAGVSPQYVNNVLAGHYPPSKKLLAAARELGIPVREAA